MFLYCLFTVYRSNKVHVFHIFNHLANYITVDVIFVSKVYSRSTKYKTFLGLLPKDDVENEIMNLLRYFMIF